MLKIHLREYDQKLFSSPASNGIYLTRALMKDLSDTLEYFISLWMSISIIDFFKEVDIK